MIKKNTALITGANGALGYELCEVFLKNGYNLVLSVRRKNKKISNLKNKNKENIEICYGDLENRKTIKNLAKIAVKKKIDLLINNAGVYANLAFGKTTIKEIYHIFEVNFFSNIYLFSLLLKKNIKKLSIININSLAGVSGAAYESIYSASKHALKGFYDSISKEIEMKNFSFLNIYTGAFKSNVTSKRNDYQNLMTPIEIAEVIFLSSKKYDSLKIKDMFLHRSK